MVTRAAAENRVYTGFWIHLCAYIVVIAGLAVLNFTRNPDNPWFLWVLGGWGIGVAAHAYTLFAAPGGKERLIDRAMDRMDRREDRREERHMHAH